MESTIIYKRGKIAHIMHEYVPLKEALMIARQKGIFGRVEINHKMNIGSDRFILSLYFINEKDKITCELFPFESFS